MKLKNQVCNLELAQKLKSLGVKQKSIFHWHDDGSTDKPYISFEYRGSVDSIWCSAFTVAELGEMLPEREETDYRVSFINIHKNKTSNGNGTWTVKFVWRTLENQHAANDAKYITYDNNLADALAKMLVRLLENHLITL